MPPTTEIVGEGIASRVTALRTSPVISRFCACASERAERKSRMAAQHKRLDINPPRRRDRWDAITRLREPRRSQVGRARTCTGRARAPVADVASELTESKAVGPV